MSQPDDAKNLRERVRRLYDDHGPALLAYACALMRDRAAAEDILHQVFLKLLSGRVSVPDPPRAYLFRAIHNAALNTQRSSMRHVEFDPESAWFEAPNGRPELAIALEAALKELPQQQTQAVILRIWAQMTFEEAASVVGVSPNTLASRYRYGLAKLRELLRNMERE